MSSLLAVTAEAATPAAIEAEIKRRAAQTQAKKAPEVSATRFIVPDHEKARTTAETVYNTWRLIIIRGSDQA